MKSEYLSRYFGGVALKELSSVEVNPNSSNQHELNGVRNLRQILGKDRKRYKARFLYLSDDDDPIVAEAFFTWYDARERHLTRSEYRLYFPENSVFQRAHAGDILIIAKCRDDTLLAIVAEKQTTAAQQVMWLFNFSDRFTNEFYVRSDLDTNHDKIEFISRLILESIGIAVEITEDDWLEDMISKFNGSFPTTSRFSTYARDTLRKDIALQEDNPDEMLMAWMDREETLFRILEKHLLKKELNRGFTNVDEFLSCSLSVLNRRKCRAGLALENHLAFLFSEYKIQFSKNQITENRAKPDFLFPSKAAYDDPDFCSLHLTILGVKSTCKDRWRQILSEADRIEKKHLLTLEAAISTNQTDEMRSRQLQLVLPRELHKTYREEQRTWLMDVQSFTQLVTERQRAGSPNH